MNKYNYLQTELIDKYRKPDILDLIKPEKMSLTHQSLEPTHKQVQDMVLPMPPNRHHHHNSVLVLAVVLVRLDDTNHGLIDHNYATLHQLSDSPIPLYYEFH
jgi:hypothetical protein